MQAQADLRRYHTFWERFVASLIDGFLYFPVTLPATIAIGYAPVPIAIAACLFTAPLTLVYTSYCHGRWGKTLGKHLAGVTVRRAEDDGPIGYGRAIRRDAPVIVFAIAGAVITISLIVGDDRDGFRMFDTYQDAFDRAQTHPDEEPSISDSFEGYGALSGWQWALAGLQWAWFVAEFSTMLLSDRRRAIHDLIGGTVVVKTSALASAAPLSSEVSAS